MVHSNKNELSHALLLVTNTELSIRARKLIRPPQGGAGGLVVAEHDALFEMMVLGVQTLVCTHGAFYPSDQSDALRLSDYFDYLDPVSKNFMSSKPLDGLNLPYLHAINAKGDGDFNDPESLVRNAVIFEILWDLYAHKLFLRDGLPLLLVEEVKAYFQNVIRQPLTPSASAFFTECSKHVGVFQGLTSAIVVKNFDENRFGDAIIADAERFLFESIIKRQLRAVPKLMVGSARTLVSAINKLIYK